MRRKRVGANLYLVDLLPGDCRLFANTIASSMDVLPNFWDHRTSNQRYLPGERLVLELVIARIKYRYHRHRWEIEAAMGTRPTTVQDCYNRARLMEDQFPDLLNACRTTEGNDAGWFCVQLAKECGYVEAMHEGVTVSSVRKA